MLINIVHGKHKVEFDQGKFDKWCVYLTRNGGYRYAPVDEEYFSFFKSLVSKHTSEKIYYDFVRVYDQTTSDLNPNVIRLIRQISASYSDSEETEIWFSVIYGGMIAEENKQGVILKKRIKRLGMHQLLMENYQPAVAAKFSINKNWRELNMLMKERGFGI